MKPEKVSEITFSPVTFSPVGRKRNPHYMQRNAVAPAARGQLLVAEAERPIAREAARDGAQSLHLVELQVERDAEAHLVGQGGERVVGCVRRV